MTGPVLHVRDRRADFRAVEVRLVGDDLYEVQEEVDVRPLVLAADIVFLAGHALVHDCPHGGVVILDVEPVADIFAVAIHGKRLAVEHVEDHEGDEFFREMIRAVIIRAVGKGHGKAIRVIIREREMIARSLARTVRRARIVGRGLREKARVAERAVDFVSAYVMKKDVIPHFFAAVGRRYRPRVPRDIEKREGSHHVRLDESFGPQD